MDNRTHVNFDMGSVLNKLRSIAEDGTENTMVNDSNFTKVMSRLTGIKDALPDGQFDNLRAGIRALYMNQRPSQGQMMAMMGLLETVLGYVASDNALFQRLKGDFIGDKAAPEAKPERPSEPAAPQEQPAAQPEEPKAQANMRGLK